MKILHLKMQKKHEKSPKMLHEFAEKSIKKQVGNWVDPPPPVRENSLLFFCFF